MLVAIENLTKRHKIAAACFNLSLLLRTLLGVGTPKTVDGRGLPVPQSSSLIALTFLVDTPWTDIFVSSLR